jgi:hypothetical protein
MTIRRTAGWQHCIDDRILEYLDDESYATAEELAKEKGIDATKVQVQERCRLLADVDLVEFLTEDEEIVELRMRGKEYLNGDVDVNLYPPPRHPAVLSQGKQQS